MIWAAVGIVACLIIKNALFPSLVGRSEAELVARLGQPFSKSVAPRPC